MIEIHPPLYQVLHALLCRLGPGSPGLRPGNLWEPAESRRTGCGGVGVGVWIVDGAVHFYVRYVPNRVLADTISPSSVAELVSAYPTAGGMYFVTKNVVPPKHSALWSWVIGWCNFLGQTAGVASVAYTVSQQILAAVSMNSHFDGEAYAFSP